MLSMNIYTYGLLYFPALKLSGNLILYQGKIGEFHNQCRVGGALQFPMGGALQFPAGGALQFPVGGALQFPAGGALQFPAGGALWLNMLHFVRTCFNKSYNNENL